MDLLFDWAMIGLVFFILGWILYSLANDSDESDNDEEE